MKEVKFASGSEWPDGSWLVERRQGQLSYKQFVAEQGRRPKEHRHGYGQNEMPVLGFDLHQTITPDLGYPLPTPPFDGFKEGADQFAARGCCLHICTASLEVVDIDIYNARVGMIWQYIRFFGLPIGWVGPNTESTLRIDDRGIQVEPTPDWPTYWGAAEKMLGKTYEIDKNGFYKERGDLKPVGTPIDPKNDFPDDSDVPPDAPRGFSSQILDVDMHRTLMPAWGTRRDAKPNPDGVRCMREWYAAGYTIQVSCAGWNPALVEDPQFAVDRSAWQRRYLRQWGIPYDRLVTKDDSDVWFDDKVAQYRGSWPDMDAAIKQRVGPPTFGPARFAGISPKNNPKQASQAA